MKIAEVVNEFCATLSVDFLPSTTLVIDIEKFLESLNGVRPANPSQRKKRLIAHINNKFRLNTPGLNSFLSFAATNGISFNYHQKRRLGDAFDAIDQKEFKSLVLEIEKEKTERVMAELLDHFRPISVEDTISRLHNELVSPTLSRVDSKPKDWSGEILSSLLCAFVFSIFEKRAVHQVLDPLSDEQVYQSDFWKHLHSNFPDLFSRENTLSLIHINSEAFSKFGGYHALREHLMTMIARLHAELANHGFFVALIDNIYDSEESISWRLYADMILYGEKHLSFSSRQSFFKRREIAEKTYAYISAINVEKAQFDKMNLGFFYQDCFILGEGDTQQLLVVFQKHQADETLIPCPECRSHNVQGNSYSSLGVKSWECSNKICPDRSKFNRGKRYSFLQLLKQQAMEKPGNLISQESVRKWQKDVQPARHAREIIEMLVTHYSLDGDKVHTFGWEGVEEIIAGRKIIKKEFDSCRPLFKDNVIPSKDFYDSSYFSRYVLVNPRKAISPSRTEVVEGVTVYLGDSLDVLRCLPENSQDGGVTSPPYYNAREYSQWDNIYTYLYDMYNIIVEMFRVLKPGSVYLFNIFDYFDNEKNVSLSAMGEKRMILGAYTIDMFIRAGFLCEGNIVWDKGDIEGKRGFNQGNFSPYYQSPFNCWEHIFVFRKPGAVCNLNKPLPNYLRQKPVFKIVGGTNVHGHTAPYPEAIPALLTSRLPRGSSVIDPFAGSMTTGVAAIKDGCTAICIERDETYYELGLSKLNPELVQPSLFSN